MSDSGILSKLNLNKMASDREINDRKTSKHTMKNRGMFAFHIHFVNFGLYRFTFTLYYRQKYKKKLNCFSHKLNNLVLVYSYNFLYLCIRKNYFMKTLIHLSTLFLILVSSCTTIKNISFYEDTDSYVDVKKEKKERAALLAKQQEEEKARQKYIQDSIAKEQERINNNPYYKEPNYSKDDYYDFEYAARIKRFYNPVNGLGYYDNWYTNYGFYGVPYYGSSIYVGCSNYYPYNSYWGNPYYSYGFSPYLGSPYFTPYSGVGYGLSPFVYGYSPLYGYGYTPYYGFSPYYGYYPYAYYNSYDINSSTYAPRGTHVGFNSPRTVNNIRSEENNISRNAVHVTPEANLPKFDETARPKPIKKIDPKYMNAINAPVIHQIKNNPSVQSTIIPRNSINTIDMNNTPINVPKGNNTNTTVSPGRPNNIGIGKPIPIQVSPKDNLNDNYTPTQKNSGGNTDGGGFSPRGGSNKNGSSIRPR